MSQDTISKARTSAAQFKTGTSRQKWYGFTALFSNSDVPAVVLFSLIGLLVAVYFISHFPQYGEIIQQSNQF